MTEDNRKRKLSGFIIPTALILFFVLIPVMMVCISHGEYTITFNDDRGVRARKIFICGDTVICMTGAETGEGKTADTGNEYSLSTLSMKDIKKIEQLVPETETPAGDTLNVDPVYLGNFSIRLQGYTGKLRLYKNKDRISGTVQFPDWGNGKVEYLRGISISGGGIRFTRSANTEAEMRRLGANSYFTQKFSGTYSNSGKTIRGFLINHRNEKHQWDAQKER